LPVNVHVSSSPSMRQLPEMVSPSTVAASRTVRPLAVVVAASALP
jgi:hypothetical protein